ncbi:MAG: TonB-dependent receptor, partial [Vicinamibacterales bacterium]
MTSKWRWAGVVGAVLVVLSFSVARSASAQSGLGGLRGAITDQQGAGLPGVTVTASSPDVLRPQSDVTNERGEYRLNNLPPGTFTLTAELPGFATFRREGILVRVGATFAIDITMQLSSLQETVTVTGDSPMIEVDKPGNVLNIDGDFQRLMPIQARRNYSDFLELTPGVISRGFDDGSGRQVYFGHGTEHFAHVLQLEGTIATNYHDAQLTYVSMGADMVQDIQVKTGGVDASSPMGVGLVMNIVTKSGGNTVKGSGAFGYQPFNWNGNNVDNCDPAPGCKQGSAGTPTTAYVRQLDVALGGPVMKDKVWFFGALRRAVSAAGISRTSIEVERINAYKPNALLFNNESESWQPFLKISGRAGRHDIQGFFQQDRLLLTGNREYNYEPIAAQSTGGPLYSGKITSVWGTRTTTTFTASYNGKGGSDASTFKALGLTGPQIIVHDSANLQGTTVQGSGRILEGGNLQSYNYQPASQIVVRGDVTYQKDGWAGNHQFQTGFFAAPRNTYDQQTEYVNGGFVLEEHRLRTPGDIAGGTVPFHRRYNSPVSLNTRAARDSDIGIYVQDTWHAGNRLTLNLGIRADFVTRDDDIFNIQRQNSTSIGPRLGFSYLLTKDSRNVLRGSYARVHEQVMGRDAITLFGANEAAGERNEYDADGDGRFETV